MMTSPWCGTLADGNAGMNVTHIKKLSAKFLASGQTAPGNHIKRRSVTFLVRATINGTSP